MPNDDPTLDRCVFEYDLDYHITLLQATMRGYLVKAALREWQQAYRLREDVALGEASLLAEVSAAGRCRSYG